MGRRALNRRAFLTAAGTASIAGFAGCGGTTNPDNPGGAKSQTPSATRTTPTNEPTADQSPGTRETLYVDGEASDGGDGTEDAPFGSIQAALEQAMPGQTVDVRPGTYREKITTVRSGSPDEPITITGPEDAVISGQRGDYGVIRIHHSHIHLTGLTVEGLLEPIPDALLAYVEGQLIQTRPHPDSDEYLRDIVITPHRIGYSRKSLIGLERTKNAEIGGFTVTGLAGADYLVGPQNDHNGELLYIGTAPNNLGSDWHPWTEFDQTRNVHIHDIDNSEGHPHAEVVDLKPGTHDIVVEYVTDRNGGQVTDDATPTAISHSGHNNVVRWCDLGEAPILVEFDADHPDWTHSNSLYGNRLHGFGRQAVVFEDGEVVSPADQQYLCGNTVEGVEDHPGAPTCPSAVPDGDGVGVQAG